MLLKHLESIRALSNPSETSRPIRKSSGVFPEIVFRPKPQAKFQAKPPAELLAELRAMLLAKRLAKPPALFRRLFPPPGFPHAFFPLRRKKTFLKAKIHSFSIKNAHPKVILALTDGWGGLRAPFEPKLRLKEWIWEDRT